MTQINTSACVPYTTKQMYDLVNDSATYPSYLPMCTKVLVSLKTPTRQINTITLSKAKLKLEFTTANDMIDSQRIDMALVDGPFKYLRATWLFKPTRHGGCEITFDLDFEFSNPVLKLAFSGFFKTLAESMVGAFCKQAALRYGKPNLSGKHGI